MRLDNSPFAPERRPPLVLIPVLAGWAALVVVIAEFEGFAVSTRVPWSIVLAIVLPTVLFLVVSTTAEGRRTIAAVDPRWAVGIQLWRVIGAVFLFRWADGGIPAGFAVPAGIGDIATGVAALFVLLALGHGLTRRHFIAFTALGVSDFIVAIGTAVAFTDGENDLLPWVLFPTLLVPFFLIVHIVSWKQLAGRLDKATDNSGEEAALAETPLMDPAMDRG